LIVHSTAIAADPERLYSDYGIQIRSTIFGDIMYKPHKVMPSASEAAKLGPYDFVIVATKALPDVQPLDTLLAPFFAPGAPSVGAYLIIANGIGVS
jgi:2-dehydropantoate 2-reductase